MAEYIVRLERCYSILVTANSEEEAEMAAAHVDLSEWSHEDDCVEAELLEEDDLYNFPEVINDKV